MTMPEKRCETAPVEAHLRRVDPARKMARFYTLSVEMALFESWTCTRSWGRIGARQGRIMVGLYASEAEALAALRSILERKQQRGYRPA